MALSRAQLETIAVHEAAHAVVALDLGVPVGGIRVGPMPDGSLGFVEAPAHEEARREAMICLAGVVGQSIHEGRELTFAGAARVYARFGGEHDLPAARRLVAEEDLAEIWIETAAIVARDWAAIEALAEELVADRELSGRRVREIIGGPGASGPVASLRGHMLAR